MGVEGNEVILAGEADDARVSGNTRNAIDYVRGFESEANLACSGIERVENLGVVVLILKEEAGLVGGEDPGEVNFGPKIEGPESLARLAVEALGRSQSGVLEVGNDAAAVD